MEKVRVSHKTLRSIDGPRLFENLAIASFMVVIATLISLIVFGSDLGESYFSCFICFIVSTVTFLIFAVLCESDSANRRLADLYTRKETSFWIKGVVICRRRGDKTSGIVYFVGSVYSKAYFETVIEIENTSQVVNIYGIEAYKNSRSEGTQVAVKVKEKIGKNGRVLSREFLQVRRLKIGDTNKAEADSTVKTPT